MLIRHTLLYLPAQILGPLTQFAAILVFTHWMAPAAYGLFTYVLVAQDFAFLLCLSWWSQYTVRYLGAHRGVGGGLLEEPYLQSEGAILVGSAVAQVAAAVLSLLFVSAPLTLGLAATSVLYIVTRSLSLHLAERARARRLILDYTLAQTAGPVLGLVLAFAAVTRVSATPAAALGGYGIAHGGVLLWLLLRHRVRFAPRRPDERLVREAAAFGLPLIAAALAAWLGANAIRLLVDHAMGAGAMGLVAVGWSLGQRLTATTAMLVTVAAFPLAVQSFRGGARGDAFAQITRNGLFMFGLVLPAALGVYMLQDQLVALLVAAPFRATTLAVLPAALAAGLCRNIRTHVVDQVCILVERTPAVLAANVAEAASVVVLCAAGLVADGVVGAAVGAALGFGGAMVASFTWAHARVGLAVPLGSTARIVAAAAIMAGAMSLLQSGAGLPDPGLSHAGSYNGGLGSIIVSAGIGGVVYLVAILALFPATLPALARQVRSRGWARRPQPDQALRSWKKS